MSSSLGLLKNKLSIGYVLSFRVSSMQHLLAQVALMKMIPNHIIKCAVHHTTPDGLEHIYKFYQTRGFTVVQQATVHA